MRKTPINKMSKKRIARLPEEAEIRKQLCERCGGTWHQADIPTKGICYGGHCEECGRPPSPPEFLLRPHEKIYRSHGGKLSLDNSVMLCYACHGRVHGLAIKED